MLRRIRSMFQRKRDPGPDYGDLWIALRAHLRIAHDHARTEHRKKALGAVLRLMWRMERRP